MNTNLSDLRPVMIYRGFEVYKTKTGVYVGVMTLNSDNLIGHIDRILDRHQDEASKFQNP